MMRWHRRIKVVGTGALLVALIACGSVDKDALTVERCKERLAVPKAQRKPSDDPRVDLDAMCVHLLDANAAKRQRGAKQ